MFGKIRFAALAAAAVFTVCGVLPVQRAEKKDCIRLHVIANSDSEEDQAVKLKVRDAVLKAAGELISVETAAEARGEIMRSGGALAEAAERTLRENGMDYGASLYLGRFDFPDRTYGNELYPAGRYEALRVVLGEGAGQNWWCVVFPPLCLVTDEPEFNDDGSLVFKSFFEELFGRLFG